MWWDNLTSLQQVSFVIATTATAIMIIFIILMLIGMDGAESFDGDIDFDADLDMDVDGDADLDFHDVDVYNHDSIISISGLRIVTIRGALAFLSIGGWTTYGLIPALAPWLAILLGVLAGAVAAILLAYAMKAVMRLESSGNLDYTSAVGKNATIYIRVPKESQGKGKVIFNHQGKLVEVDAITKDKEDLLTKTEVKIVGLENETTLIVKK